MKNILSYQLGSRFTGKEILEFINQSTSKEVKRLRQHYSNVKEDAIYELQRLPFGPGTDSCRFWAFKSRRFYKLAFVRVDKSA